MSLAIFLFVCLPTIIAVVVAALRWRGSESWKKGLNVPPGSMGWPLLGETIGFMKSHPCTTLGDYLEERTRKYGKIYKSNIFGSTTIVSSDAELNRFVLLNDRLFEPSFPKSVEDILGKTSLLLISGEMHRYMKWIVINFMGISRLKNHFLEDAERCITQILNSWKEDTPFSAKDEARKVAFNLMVKNILSMTPGEPETEQLRKLYATFMKGMLAFPLNVPGTAYRKALQSRETILKVMKRILEERACKKEAGIDEIGESDLLGFLLEQSNLTSEQFGDLLLGALFGGHETTAITIAMALYFLQDCHKAIEQLREEHLNIIQMKKQRGGQKLLTWEDYKRMEFSQCVISETLRLGGIIRFVHRRARTDIYFKGYDIPSGWKVIPVLAAPHLDSSVYENPQKFDPWRWQANSMSSLRSDNYMPFGQGLHKCAGMELARMEISVLLHHLVLNFGWELAEPDPPLACAFPDFPKGLPIKVRRISVVQ